MMGLIRAFGRTAAIIAFSLLAILFITSPANREVRRIHKRPEEHESVEAEELNTTRTLNPTKSVPSSKVTITLASGHLNNGSFIRKPELIVAPAGRLKQANPPTCPRHSPYLIGRLSMDVMGMEKTISEEDVTLAHGDILPGGHWAPTDCKAIQKVAIVIPFRDRQSHLNTWLLHTIPILKRQLLDFRIIVAEQEGDGFFNKGRLFNAAFEFVIGLGNISCVIFHDVDLYLEDDRNIYFCTPKFPRHLGAYVDTLGYSVMYDYMLGGVVALATADYFTLNGYSNKFWGWGGEDDDLGLRIYGTNLTISRPSKAVGRYRMMKHHDRSSSEGFNKRWDILASSKTRWKVDGFNKREWNTKETQVKPLYYKLLVNVGEIAVPTTTTPAATNGTAVSKKGVTHQS